MSLGWLAPPDSAQAVSAFCFPNDYRISALKVQGWSLYLQLGHRDCSMAKIQKNRGEEEKFENAVEEQAYYRDEGSISAGGCARPFDTVTAG